MWHAGDLLLHCMGMAERRMFNYADCSDIGRRWRVPSSYSAGRRYDQPALAALESAVLGSRPRGGQGIGDRRDLGTVHRPPGRCRLGAGQAVPRPRSTGLHAEQLDRRQRGLSGIEGGDNQVNHGHLDLGNFVMDALGVRWGREWATRTYDLPGFWDMHPGGQRWKYYRQGRAAITPS